MNNQWVIKPQPSDEIVRQLVEKVWLSKPLATILAQRGISNFEQARSFFRPELNQLHDPFLMKDMELAVSRIILAIENQEKILVFGDYDVDGTTAVAMVYDFLKPICPDIGYYVPDRYVEGYGISTQGIDYAFEQGYSLVIALDCGIKAVEKVEYAVSKNIDFIICDHHLPGDVLPKAVAVLDPKRADCNYPFKELSGCGIGFKLLQALSSRLKINQELLFEYLDLLVVSIAADMVPIVDENRTFAYFGLKKLQEAPRLGLSCLLGETKREALNISTIVFQIAPKINASGRLEHAAQSVDLLVSKDKNRVEAISDAIAKLNDTRKKTDQTVTQQAVELIRKNGEEQCFSTVVYHPDWHKGVLGIVASRLIETFYRPTLVLTDGNEGEISGSARSIKDFDLYEVIDECSELLTRYGGHKFAAGLTMKKENFEAFKMKFEELVRQKIKPIQRKPSIEIDTELDFSEIDDKFLRILKQIGPFGPENMTPLFLTRNLKGGNFRLMGKNNEHISLTLMDANGVQHYAVGFGFGSCFKEFKFSQNFDVIYSIEENHWKDKVNLQFILRDVRFNDF